MRGEVRLGRVFGIEIDLHYSWFFIAALLTTSLAGHLYTINRDWPAILVWSLAGATAIAFFAAILAHELSHAAVARLRGVPVPSIMLFALGGMARMSRDAADPRTEFWMGLAGPAASILIGGAALALARLLGWNFTATPDTPGLVMLVWFGYINLTLAVFNMIPGFPLDGGRVLRAAVWWLTGNQARATRIAAGLGQIVAAAFMVFGLFSVVAGGGVGGLWLAFIGWFLSDAARAARAEIEVTERLRGVRVGDVMARDCATVPRTARIDEIADEVLRTGRRCFVVVDDGRVAGLLTPQEMRQVERTHWHSTLAGDVMKPIERLHHVTAGAPVTEALEMLAREDVNQLLVLEEDRLRGIISRDQILRLLSARAELSM